MTRSRAAAAARCGAPDKGAGDESHTTDTMTLRSSDDDLSRAPRGDGLSVDEGDDLLEYDPEPVFRRMGTLNCKVGRCPNFMGRCPLHGKERITCRVKGCDRFDQKRGLCTKHLGTDKGTEKLPAKQPSPPRKNPSSSKKAKKKDMARRTGQSKGKGEAEELPPSTPISTKEKQASTMVSPEMDKDVCISMYNSGKCMPLRGGDFRE